MKRVFYLLFVLFLFGCSSSKSSNSSIVDNGNDISNIKVSFSYSISNNLEVSFESSIFGLDKSNVTYFWDFGDNKGTSSVKNPIYPYNEAGEYNVVLEVTNNIDGKKYSYNEKITVNSNENISVKITSTVDYNTVIFSSAVTGLPSGAEVTYKWDFGDETLNNTSSVSLENPIVTYNNTGIYTVSLIITVNGKEYTAESISVDIINIANISITAGEPDENNVISFSSTLNIPSSESAKYLWDFGGAVYEDNQNSVANPKVTYKHGGIYNVVLNVTSGDNVYRTQLSVTYKKVEMYGNTSVVFLAKSDGLFSWGDNYYGQTGTGANTSTETKVKIPKAVKNIDMQNDKVKNILLVNNSVFCLMESGNLYSWGSNSGGILGFGTESTENEFEPALLMENVSEIANSGTYMSTIFAVKKDGSVYSWGSSRYNTLGYESTDDVSTPTLISGLENISKVTGGFQTAYAVSKDGKVFSWGKDTYGDLGQGTNYTTQITPLQVTGNNFSSVFVKDLKVIDTSVYALTDTGELYSWGLNDYGKLGISMDYTPYGSANVPYKVEIGKSITSLYNLNKTTFAVTDDGKLYSWGHNGIFGKVGTGSSNTLIPLPVMVSGDDEHLSSSAVKVTGLALKENSTDRGHILAVTSSGRLYSWGDNETGQLGLGNKLSSNVQLTATRVNSVIWQYKILKAYTSYSSSYAVSDNGTLFSWGDNSTAQLGGRGGVNYEPRAVDIGENVKDVFLITDSYSSVNTSVFAITDNETVYSFGYHNGYILGINNSNESVKLPKKLSF